MKKSAAILIGITFLGLGTSFADVNLPGNIPLSPTKGILCKNLDAKANGCDHILIDSAVNDSGFNHIQVSEYDQPYSCGLIGYADTVENTGDSDLISLSGESTSSAGWSRSTVTGIKLEINLKSGQGTLKVKRGKKPEYYMTPAETLRLAECVNTQIK
ncbi:MAG: hypothetical protein ACXWRE_16440 [Pseudobdellovibrionaceae bacterium]